MTVFFKSSGRCAVSACLYEGGIGTDDRELAGTSPGVVSVHPWGMDICRQLATSPAPGSRRGSTVFRWRARFVGNRSRRTISSIGSFTSAAFSRLCVWDRGKPSG